MTGTDAAVAMTGTDAAVLMLTSAIFLALAIERLIEILKAVYDVIEFRTIGVDFWNERAAKLQARIHYMLQAQAEEGEGKKTLSGPEKLRLNAVLWRLRPDGDSYKNAKAISAVKLRTAWVKNIAKVLSVLIGIGVAFAAGINIFELVESDPDADPDMFSGAFGVFVTGIAMGLGSGPLHKIISALERAKKRRVADS